MPSSPPRPRKWRRRLLIASAMLAMLLVAAVAALPWLLGTSAVRGLVLAEVNRRYAPSELELTGISASWTGPIRMSGVVLRDEHGKAVVSAPGATLDRSLLQLATDPDDVGTLTLHGAAVDIERREDGSIDLAEALGPYIEGDGEEDEGGPEARFTLAIDAGSLRLTSPELAEPLRSERLDMTLVLSPAPITWDIDLADGDERVMTVDGHYGGESPERTEAVVAIDGTRWPLAVAQAGVEARFVFDGQVDVRYTAASLGLSGDATLTDVALGGPTLGGDSPRFARVDAAWDLDMIGDGLAVRTLELDSPVATLGLADGVEVATLDGSSRWVGRVDLAKLAAQLPNTIPLRDGMAPRSGTADLAVTVHPSSEAGARPLDLRARIADVSAEQGGRIIAIEPVTLAARVLRGDGGAIAVESAMFDAPFGKATAEGDLDEGIVLEGTIDLAALDRQVRQVIDLGEVGASGSARFGGDYTRSKPGEFAARMAIEGRDVRLLGVGEEPIVRDLVRLDLIAVGPAASTGLPTGWETLHLATKLDGIDVVANASPDGDAYDLEGRFTMIERETPAGDRMTHPANAPEVAAVGEPTSLGFEGSYHPAADRLDVATMVARHRLGSITASGRIDALSGARMADLGGRVDPDWAALTELVAEATEPDARVSGRGRPFRLIGPLGGGSLDEILANVEAELGVDLEGAEAFGLAVGPTPLVAQVTGGDVRIAPIATTLNGGRVDLRPDVQLGEEGLVVVTMEPGSTIEGVEINDEVSARVLAYIAPILREAAEVDGRISARFERATIPVAGPEGRTPPLDLAATVAFENVTYGPGPLMRQILGPTGAANAPRLRIDQPVNVAIAEGRVYQSGLTIQAVEGVDVVLEGSVGLDQTLAIRAGVPISDRMLGNQELLGDLLGGTRVGLPIGGTLGRPALDARAMRVGMREQGGQLLNRATGIGARQLFKLLDEGEGDDDEGPSSGSDRPAPAAEGLLRGLMREVIPGGGSGRRP